MTFEEEKRVKVESSVTLAEAASELCKQMDGEIESSKVLWLSSRIIPRTELGRKGW